MQSKVNGFLISVVIVGTVFYFCCGKESGVGYFYCFGNKKRQTTLYFKEET